MHRDRAKMCASAIIRITATFTTKRRASTTVVKKARRCIAHAYSQKFELKTMTSHKNFFD